MVGRIGRVSIIIAIVLYSSVAIPTLLLCFAGAVTSSAVQSPLCPIIRDVGQYLYLICGFLTVVFLMDLFCDYSSAREREMRRQIALESPRVIMPDDEKRRD